MRRIARWSTILFVLLASVGCDQATKSVARATLADQPPRTLVAGLVHLQYAENTGAFLSLGAGLPAPLRAVLLVVLVGALLTGGLFYLLRERNLGLGQWLGLTLLLAGGVGNLIDRILNDGRVIDFMILGIGPLHTGIFNVADLVLVIGLALFGLSSAVAERRQPVDRVEPAP